MRLGANVRASEAYKDRHAQGLQAFGSADDRGREASRVAPDGVASPESKAMAEGGTTMFARHPGNIAQLLQRAGGGPGGMPNAIMEGIRAGSKHTVEGVEDPAVRDADMIAAAQVACHSHIASYGTLASTAKHLGLDEDARMLEEVEATSGSPRSPRVRSTATLKPPPDPSSDAVREHVGGTRRRAAEMRACPILAGHRILGCFDAAGPTLDPVTGEGPASDGPRPRAHRTLLAAHDPAASFRYPGEYDDQRRVAVTGVDRRSSGRTSG